MKKTLIIIGISLGSIIGLIAFLIFILPLFFPTPDYVDVVIDIPQEITANEDFDVVYTLTNTDDRSRILDSIDIETGLLEEMQLINISEKTTDRYTSFGFRTFEFRNDLIPEVPYEIIFTFRAPEGIYYSTTDICINNAAACISDDISILVK